MDTLNDAIARFAKEGFIIEFSYLNGLDAIRIKVQKDNVHMVRFVLNNTQMLFYMKEMVIKIKEQARKKWRDDEYGKILARTK